MEGNLYHDDGIDVFVPTVGAYTVAIFGERSNLTLVVESEVNAGGIK